MTRDKSKHVSLTTKQEGFATYGDRNKGKILGYGNVGNFESSSYLEETRPLILEKQIVDTSKKSTKELPKEWSTSRNLSLDNIIGDINKGVTTHSSLNNFYKYMAFVSQLKPKFVEEALLDEIWLLAMLEELNQLKRNEVWDLVPRTNTQQVIETKWVFRNKIDETGFITKNKACLVAKGYSQEEGIDYDDTYSPIARLEATRLLLVFVSLMDFKLFQIDVKSAFFNGYIKEEVYVSQPPRFIDYDFPNHVYKLKKALYGLNQAPRSWYKRLSNFLLEQKFERGKVVTTFFIKKTKKDILLVQIYVDDIIFGATNDALCKEFAKIMQGEFEMSMMGE